MLTNRNMDCRRNDRALWLVWTIIRLAVIIQYSSCFPISFLKSAEEIETGHEQPSVFASTVEFLKETNELKNMVHEVFGTNGTLEKDGFYTLEEELNDNEMSVKSKCWGSYAGLLHDMERLQVKDTTKDSKTIMQDGIHSKNSLNAIMNSFMSDSSRQEAINWLKGQIRGNVDIQSGKLKDCKVHVIIEYKCCVKSELPLLSPQFAEIRLKIG